MVPLRHDITGSLRIFPRDRSQGYEWRSRASMQMKEKAYAV